MSKDHDTSLCKLLHSFEIGLLSETDREAFELHLLDCAHCLAEVDRFKDVSLHLRHSPDLQESLGEVKIHRPKQRLDGGRKRSPKFAALTLAIVGIVALLVLQPWQIEVKTTDEIQALANNLLIMSFANVVNPDDPDHLGEIIADLLITDLAESRHVSVFSSQRLLDALAHLKTKGIGLSDPRLPRLAADHVGARWLITGKILRETPSIVLTANLQDASTRRIVASQRVDGLPGADVFSLVDDLSAQIRNDLALPADSPEDHDKVVGSITTSSWEAYREYHLGVRLLSQYHTGDAERAFARAVGFDSTFAMGWYYLTLLRGSPHMTLAEKYAHKADRRGQLKIRALGHRLSGNTALYVASLKELTGQFPDEKEAYLNLGLYEQRLLDFREAVIYFERALEVDPLFGNAYNYLAYLYVDSGNAAEAIKAANEYVALSANKSNAYDTRAEVLALLGDIEGALSSYRQALEIKPTLLPSLEGLGSLAIMIQDYDLADSCFVALDHSRYPWLPAAINRDYASIEFHQGKFREGLRILERDQEVLQRPGRPNDLELAILSQNHLLRARALREIGLVDSAFAAIDDAVYVRELLPTPLRVRYLHLLCQVLVEKGNLSVAEELVEELRTDTSDAEQTFDYLFVAGYLHLANDQPQEAVILLEKAAAKRAPSRMFPAHFKLGVAYVEAGQYAKAIGLFEKQLPIYSQSRRNCPIRAVKMHYYLGIAYEETGRIDDAVSQYQTFLDIWRNADSGIVLIEDVTSRLSELKSE